MTVQRRAMMRKHQKKEKRKAVENKTEEPKEETAGLPPVQTHPKHTPDPDTRGRLDVVPAKQRM